jgi:S1-C subfamily serine protease
LVAGVTNGGEGERASLEAGDVILSVDRKDVSTVADCEAALAGKAMARGALVEFARGGARRYAIVGGEGE